MKLSPVVVHLVRSFHNVEIAKLRRQRTRWAAHYEYIDLQTTREQQHAPTTSSHVVMEVASMTD